jgi:ribulose-phosphate 3-epimerase
MVADPVPWAVTWEKLGADMVVFHVESISVDDLRSFISYTKMSVGISANNDTSFMTLLPYLSLVDYVQVMGIAKIGQQGQSFDKTALLRITEIHTMFPHLPISIDGSMNESTIPQVLSLPVERIIVGSAIQKSNAPQTAYTTLQKLASSTR